MKIRMKIRIKMLLSVVLIASLVLIFSTGYLTNRLRDISLKSAIQITNTQAREHSNLIKASLDNEMGMARSLAQSFSNFRSIPQDKIEENTERVLEAVAKENPDFLSVWVSWELYVTDPNWNKTFGRTSITYYRENDLLKYSKELKNVQGDIVGSTYYQIKTSKKEALVDPYEYTYLGSNKTVLETSACVPVLDGERFAGLFGFDFELTRYQKLIQNIKPYEGSFSMLLSNNATIIAHKNNDYIGSQFDSIYPLESSNNSLLTKVKYGESFNYIYFGRTTGIEYYATFVPISIGKSDTPWSLGIIVPMKTLRSETNRITKNAFFVILIGLVILIGVIWFIAISITNPLVNTTHVLSEMALGKIDISQKLNVKSGDEIEEMSNSVNTLIDGLNKTASFAKEIGKGNLDQEFDLLSDKDVLGNSLLEMRKSLKIAKEQEEIRKLEDQKQNWATQGLARFAEILRQNTDDMKEFSYHIISNLVKYINANQGGLFIINDDDKNDKFIELLACYAYERRKHLEKRVDMGVGVIGRCIKEQRSIYMTDLPKDYINITSGLGQAVPNVLLVVPLKVNDEIYGVVELAGFNKFEDHIIKFVEEVGESIASTISSTKINIRTNQLLEQSQQQSEEMAAQEEEMRQNMEELQATQEESARRSAEMQGLLDALNSANLVIEYDLEGFIISVNKNYLNLIGITKDKMIGTHQSDNMNFTKEQMQDNKRFWSDLRNGLAKKETDHVTFNGKEYVFVATYTPILDEYGAPVKVLKIATDISELYHKDKKTKKG
jgi:methyl-accepting chemotaxis protein